MRTEAIWVYLNNWNGSCVSFPELCCSHWPQTGGFIQQKFILSLCWRLGVQNQGVAKPCCQQSSSGEYFLPLPASGSSRNSLACSNTSPISASFSHGHLPSVLVCRLCLHTVWSLCVSVFAFYKNTSHLAWPRAHLTQVWFHLNLIMSAKTPLPNKVTFTGTKGLGFQHNTSYSLSPCGCW